MRVELGHVAGVNQVDGRYVRIDGERITTFDIEEGMDPAVAMAIILDALPYHIAEGHAPLWLTCPDPELRKLLLAKFSLKSDKTRRPLNWGKEKST